jgi:NAD+ synthase (glutamine-hydrolysing)
LPLGSSQVLTATVDVEEVRSYRACRPSFRMQSASHPCPPEQVNLELMRAFLPAASARRDIKPTDPIELTLSTPEQECLLGPACWLWDYLRRSGGR